MGNCCSAPKKSPENPQTTMPSSQTHQVSKCLKFKSKSLNFSYKLDFHPSKSLNSYLNHIIINHPELASEELIITKANQEIISFSLSLRDLEIFPSETLYIDIRPQPVKTCSLSVSNEEIAEEESTTKLQILGIKARLGGGKVRTESTGDAASLWRSAMPSPRHRAKFTTKDSDASSLNPLDVTIENKMPPVFQACEVKNGQSVILDSDDSYLKSDVKARDSINRHPYDFFRDLQGPFSVLKLLN
jgi:hypothetical protein